MKRITALLLILALLLALGACRPETLITCFTPEQASEDGQAIRSTPSTS